MSRVAYILDIFPAISETFIANEILEVEKRGIEVVIFSRRKENGPCHRIARDIKAQVSYLPDAHSLRSGRLIACHAKFVLSHPIRYFKTFSFALMNRADGLFWFFKISCLYASMVGEQKASHIHAHFASVAGEYAMLVSMLLGVPYTFTAHGWHDIFEYPPKDFRNRASYAKKVITVSNYNKNYLTKKHAIPKEKIEVIRCGIDVDSFDGCVKDHNDETTILSVGRLHPIKGTEYLVKACKLLKEKRLNFKCVLIGDGGEKASLQALINSLNLSDTVSLEGAKTTEEVREWYPRADIYVQPSVCEGIPLSVMEAMASELPVVATKITGLPELVEDSVTGYLVNPKDEQAIADAIESLILNPEKRFEMGSQGRKKVEREFSLREEVTTLTKVWFDGKD